MTPPLAADRMHGNAHRVPVPFEGHLRHPGVQTGVALVTVLSLTILPFLILGRDAYVVIHDNLDSEFVYLHNLVASGTAFAYGTGGTIEHVMNGLPRSALRSGYNFTVVLFSVLDPFVAYVVNSLVVRVVGFVGMLLLLKHHVLPSSRHRTLHLLIAVLFAVLPFYSLYGITVAGQPLFFWAYCNVLRRRSRWYDWLIIVAFPFYTALYFIGIFLVVVLGGHMLYRWFTRKAVDWRTIVPVTLLGLGYCFVEWPMLHAAFLDDAWISHRVEFDPAAFPHSGLSAATSTFLHGHYHAASLSVAPILAALALGAPVLFRAGRAKTVAAPLAAIVLIVLFHALYPFLIEHAGASLSLLTRVQFDRFYFFLPLLWFMVLASALSALRSDRRLRYLVVPLILTQGFLIARSAPEVRNNLAILGGGEVRPTFADFFDPPLFASIRESIGEPPGSYRVVAIGMHPSILQYNGFHTLDSYQNNYPVAYKHTFRRIIAPELAKDPDLKRYFDAWGNRCYVFSAELGTEVLWNKDTSRAIEALSIDTRALRDLGGRFVLSSVPVLNASELRLIPRGAFEHPRSFWRIHLYEVDG